MGKNIYYMYDLTTGYGYIGQNTDDQDDKRILDHYSNYLKMQEGKPVKYDGGAVLIQESKSLSNIRYKIFKDATYGIPKDVYDKFLSIWSIDGDADQTWDDLTAEQQLDLAEIMHNMYAHLRGDSWNRYNRLLGGMSSTGDDSQAMRVLSYHLGSDGIDALQRLQNETGVQHSISNDYTLTRFKCKKTVDADEFSKVVYPLQYLISKEIVQTKIKTLISKWFQQYLQNIFNENPYAAEMEKFFASELKSNLVNQWLDQAAWKKNIAALSTNRTKITVEKVKIIDGEKATTQKTNKEFVQAAITKMEEMLDKKQSKSSIRQVTEKINRAIKKMVRTSQIEFEWEIDTTQTMAAIKSIFKNIRNKSFTKMADVFSLSKWGNFTYDLGDIQLPTGRLVVLREKYTTLPDWALDLKRSNLLSGWQDPGYGKLKVEICKSACEGYFQIIEKQIKPSHYDSKNTLQMRVYAVLGKNDYFKLGSYSWDFVRSLIEIWHEYTYGADAWIRWGQTKFASDEDKSYQKYRFARKDVVEKAKTLEDAKKIHWYQGSFYASSGVNQGDLNSAAEMLAAKWKW